MHNSLVADYGQIYEKLKLLFRGYGIKCVVDSAFLTKKSKNIIKTSQTLTRAKTKYNTAVKTEAT